MSFWGPARARHGFWKSYGVDEKAMYRVEDGEDAEGRPGVVHVLVMPDLDGCPDVPGDEDRWETARKRLEKLDVGECESAMHVLRIGWCKWSFSFFFFFFIIILFYDSTTDNATDVMYR